MNGVAGTALEVRVLGEIRLVVDGEDRPLSRQARRLLACLALAGGDALALDRLAAILHPAGQARRASLRMAVWRLRQHLGDRLAAGVAGYRLVLGADDTLDLDRAAVALSDALAATGSDRVPCLRAALGAWTGVPAAEFADESWAEPVAARWEEQRRTVVEDLAEALLAAGRANEAVGLLDDELTDLAYRERPVELLMRALAACGRPTDALRAYARFRSVLRAEVGVEPSARLRAVERELLASVDAPPARARAAPAQSPPATLIGRDADVISVGRVLDDHRLVTLTGVGGVGKTCLAMAVAASANHGFDDVAVVELAPISDTAALAAAVADSLGVIVGAEASGADSLVAALDGRDALIVLDNCEHVADGAAALVEAVLMGTRGVRVLATSRQPLGVAGEQRWPVDPLDAVAARRLFVERARAVQPGFTADDVVLDEICRRLDGVPLAIELAAARVLVLSVDDIAARLDDRFQLLVGVGRGPQRHRTLGSAIGWSFDLLEADERDALCACSVFAGGFDLAAALAVTGGDEYEVIGWLESLTRQSMLAAQPAPRATRFSMLETIRQFAADRAERPEELRARHAAHFAAVARAGEFAEADLDNLRAAFEWALRHDDVDTAAGIAADTTVRAWQYCRFEPIGWVEEIIDLATERRSVLLTRLHMAASQCTWLGQPDRALAHVERVRDLLDDASMERVDLADLRAREATAHLFAGRVEHAVELDTALVASGGAGRLFGLCGLLYDLPELGRFDEALAIVDEVLDAARASGSQFFLCWALTGVARTLAVVDPIAAIDAAYEALAVSRADRIRVAEIVVARDVAALESAHGDRLAAADLFLLVLHAFHRAGDWVNLTVTFGELAHHFATSLPDVAAVLWGAAHNDPAVRQVRGRRVTEYALRVALGDLGFEAAAARGAAMTRVAAVTYAESHLVSP